MEIVTERIAKNHVHNHLIFFEVNDPSTLASYILLKNDYRDMDITVTEEKDWRYLFIAKRTFLRHQKFNGSWNCHYCGKELLHMHERGHKMRRNQHKKYVTVDHKEPACKCHDKSDSSNFLVSCHDCNTKKGAMNYETFIKRKNGYISERA